MGEDTKATGMTSMKELGAEGGKARAASLTPGERSEAAKRAADARWGIRKATHDGEIRIGDIVIPCAVLEDGTRLITQRGFASAMGGAKPSSITRRGAGNLPAIMNAGNLKPFIDNELEVTATPVDFKTMKGSRALGIHALAIPKMCKVWMRADKAGKLTQRQKHYAVRAEILVHGFAELGILALIDEATGYQEVRDRHALQEILDQFLSHEFAAWAKTFPDEFYRQIFRLRNWKWMGMSKNRPQCVASYTKDIIYARLAPGILKELQIRNPVGDNGRRKGKHFQLLTGDVGHPALTQHLHAAIGLMRVSDSWDEFKRMIDRAFPRRGDTLQLPLFKDEDFS